MDLERCHFQLSQTKTVKVRRALSIELSDAAGLSIFFSSN